MKILAVDDDETILELLKEALAAYCAYDVVTVASADHAIRVIKDEERPFDCFLIDIQMPGMDGIELCSVIRSTPGYEKTPIVMLTAMSQNKYVDRAFSAGATDYVTKPFDFFKLGSRLSLAHKLVKEQKLVSDSIVKVEAMQKKHDIDLCHSLGEPIEVQDVDRGYRICRF